MVGLIAAVFDKCEELNTANTESSMTILMLDEALAFAVDNVCDYTQLAKLDKYSTLHSVTCIKGSGHGCMASAVLNVCYRNTSQIRKCLEYWSDHGYALISRENDNPGASLPQGLTGQQSAVTWVQCESFNNVKKAASDMIHKLEQVDKEAEMVILFNSDKAGRCREIA